MAKQLEIVNEASLQEWKQFLDRNLQTDFEGLKNNSLSTTTFDYYASAAAVYSSKIEGENIDIDFYVNYRKMMTEDRADTTLKVDDLYNAYIFAEDNQLDELGVHYAHGLITRNVLQETHQGKYRSNSLYIPAANGEVDYVAAEPDKIAIETAKLYHDIRILIERDLEIEEVFYYASIIHLTFLKILPYERGNGRTARLLEKWFLAEKLGKKAWNIASEKYYFENLESYHANIKNLGIEYTDLDYGKALPFVLMLPNALI